MTVFDFISLFGGLSLFLYGMRLMSEGLEKSSSASLKRAMEKVTNSPFMGFLLGLVVTAVIQSSTATIVLVSGLVAAGIITLHQSLGIIIGANVGTTVTGQIIRLLDINENAALVMNFLRPQTLAPLAAIIGILLIMMFKFRNSNTIGSTVMGFGVLFTGLLNMTAAIKPLSESELFSQLFLMFADQPVIGFFIGAMVAFTIQSSSASVGILQTLATTGQLSLSSVYSVILGIYLGDCVTTAIVCSIGAKADAKRTGLIHILYNLTQIALIAATVTLLSRLGVFGSIWNSPINSGGIANTHTIFKLACAVLLLPVCGLFEKLSMKIIKDDKAPADKAERDLKALDEALFDSPMLALASVHKIISIVARRAIKNVAKGFKVIFEYDSSVVSKLNDNETRIDKLTDHVNDYLVKLSQYAIDDRASEELNYYIRCVFEFERVGDHAVNLSESAAEMKDKGLALSEPARRELELLGAALDEIMSYTGKAFYDGDLDAAMHIEPIEEVIDDLVETMRSNHLARMRSGDCNIYTGSIFLDILVNVERISDQCSNIGVHTCAMLDPQIAEMQHDYIQHLHNGENETYNREFRKAHEYYFSRLKALEAEASAEENGVSAEAGQDVSVEPAG